MKFEWILGFFVLATITNAHAGSEGVGGGDICEDRIKIIRDDLSDWIQRGGPSGLSLPTGVTVAQYSDQMLAQINAAKIRCVGPSDSGYPILINGTPKVCRYDKNAQASAITCDYQKLKEVSESDQYVLIHHEFAGLSEIEMPSDDDSHYAVSNQISGYLENSIVKKLVVKPSIAHLHPGDHVHVERNNSVYITDAVIDSMSADNRKAILSYDYYSFPFIHSREKITAKVTDLYLSTGCIQGTNICVDKTVTISGEVYIKKIAGVNSMKNKVITVMPVSEFPGTHWDKYEIANFSDVTIFGN